MAISLVTFLRILFGILGSLMLLTLVYTIFSDGLPFRTDLLTPWMAATLVDFYINVVPIAAWVIYKESNWIRAGLWIVLLICLGSLTTCGYILLQLMKLSTKESEDPIYHVLLCHSNKYSVVDKHRQSHVLIARVVFAALGLLMLGTLIYTLLTDGSPFRKELFTPWMDATLIDFYINVTALSVWVAYKESSWVTAVVWIILLICFGSITTCVYITIQLSRLTCQDPIYVALFKSGDRRLKWAA
ncbi:uncharacterized protein LOC126785409 isoform X2 [Argentina anserina]|uniref:uncharacterized protein LOC126785409 isoform X2 n=1 Tax=Argentina anserina TaxID=57926 RepID=UPI0021767759|nr:uncharacterized protein LOC126785409 isoform X2 [Potentilla anserina]